MSVTFLEEYSQSWREMAGGRRFQCLTSLRSSRCTRKTLLVSLGSLLSTNHSTTSLRWNLIDGRTLMMLKRKVLKRFSRPRRESLKSTIGSLLCSHGESQQTEFQSLVVYLSQEIFTMRLPRDKNVLLSHQRLFSILQLIFQRQITFTIRITTFSTLMLL